MTEKRGVSMPDELFAFVEATRGDDQTVSGRIRELMQLGKVAEDELAREQWLHPEDVAMNEERVREAIREWCERQR